MPPVRRRSSCLISFSRALEPRGCKRFAGLQSLTLKPAGSRYTRAFPRASKRFLVVCLYSRCPHVSEVVSSLAPGFGKHPFKAADRLFRTIPASMPEPLSGTNCVGAGIKRPPIFRRIGSTCPRERHMLPCASAH